MAKQMKRQILENRTVFYRSRFEIFPDADIDAEIWPQIIHVLQAWLERKERVRGSDSLFDPLTADLENLSAHFESTYEECIASRSFAYGEFDRSTEQSYLGTKAAFEPGRPLVPKYWAMDYLEKDSARWYRRWYTNVGITSSGTGTYIVNVRVSILDDPTFISAQPEVPQRNTPRFISDMLDMPSCITIAGDMQLRTDPVRLTGSSFDSFINDLTSDTRSVPMLVISPYRTYASSTYLVDPGKLARKLRGSAIVYTLDLDDDELRYRYFDVFGKGAGAYNYRIGNGMLRVFFPGVDLGDPDGSRRHHYYTSKDLSTYDIPRLADDICGAITRLYRRKRNEVLDVFGVESQAERIRRKEQLSELRSRQLSRAETAHAALEEMTQKAHRDQAHYQKALEAKEDELKAAQELIETYEELFEEAGDASNDDVEELEAEVTSLQEEIQGLRQSVKTKDYTISLLNADKASAEKGRAELEARAAVLSEMRGFPKTAEESLELAESAFPEHLEILPDAHQSAEEFQGDPSEVYDILRSMATDLWNLVFDEPDGGEITERFQGATGYAVTFRESSMTKSDSKLMKLRECEYKGRTIDISPHVKGKSGKRNATLRVHFYIDHESKKIVIGYCGGHMKTSGTRRKSL